MKFRPWLIAVLSLVAFYQVAAAPTATPASSPPVDKVNGLLNNSPFGAPKTVAGASTGAEPLEFRAVLEENGNKFFSIYDTATRRSNWVEFNDPVNGFSVKTYDAAKEVVMIEYQGKVMTLAIKRAPAVPQAIQQQQPPVPGQNVATGPVPLPGGQVGPTTVDQQRIQQIQEEIRRRRALRNQSANPAPGTNGAPQPNYGNGPQPVPSNSAGPVPQPGGSAGPQLIPPKN